MSKIRAKVRLATKLTACCDGESSRYALGSIQIIPRDGGVYASATDGRVLATVEADGESDGPHLLPMALAKPGLESALNGRWETTTPATRRKPASVTTGDETEGRFPKCADAHPQVVADEAGLGLRGFGHHGDGFQLLHIDARLLAKLGQALSAADGDEPQALTLLVPVGPQPLCAVTSAIPVVGAHGIGVLMPLGLGGSRGEADAMEGLAVVERYEAIREGYATASRT